MDRDDFKEYLLFCKKNALNIRLYFDIETLMYNINEGKKKPSYYKNITYALGVDYSHMNKIKHVLFFDHADLYEFIFETFRGKNGNIVFKGAIEMIAHNSNKYDNHFLLQDLIYYYNVNRENMHLKNASTNVNTKKLSDYKKKSEKDGVVLEKRVKSKNNLELTYFLNGIKFYTTDNLLKTNASIKTLGKKLLDKGLITEDFLKTDYEYSKYDSDIDMTEKQARSYARNVYENLTEDEKIYIRNDCHILAYSVEHYTDIYPDFDYSLFTLTSNISKKFNTNDITSIQMLNKTISKPKLHLKYTDYFIGNENFYDFLKPFYRGGMNFYNQDILGKIIEDEAFGIDINSSYPFAMDNHLIPTFLSSYKVYDKESRIKIIIKDELYYLYRMTREEFNVSILEKIDSVVIRQMLVKYYTQAYNDYVNINTYTIKLIQQFVNEPLTHLNVLSVVVYECIEFGSRDFLFDNYFIKTQGKLENKIVMDNAYDYEILDEPNDILLSEEEIYISKVYNNGAYGIPALRPYFNLFRLTDDKKEYENIKNGFINTERNIMFSIFVTSVSFYNLLTPMFHMKHSDIDNYFLYTDTDSLYMKKEALQYIDENLFDDISLGKWSFDAEKISKFYALNHKKYAYYNEDKQKIVLKCGGVNLNSFTFYKDGKTGNLCYNEKNCNRVPLTFEEFINTQFHDKAEIKSTKSIMNQQGVISIYEGTTVMDMGTGYPSYFTQMMLEIKNKLLDNMRNAFEDEGTHDILYIESEVMSLSVNDLFYQKQGIENKKPLYLLKYQYDSIKEMIM